MTSFESIDRLRYYSQSPQQQFMDPSAIARGECVSRREQGLKPTVSNGGTRDFAKNAGATRQLAQFQRMEAISRVTGGIAHNVNNLLTGVIGFCHLLTDGSANRDNDGIYLANILGSADRAADLVKQLLAFSQQQILTLETLDLNCSVADSEPLVQRLGGEHVKVVVDLDLTPEKVTADPRQIKQVIANLAANAVEAMPEGGLLTLRTRQLEIDGFSISDLGIPKGPYVVLEVEDSGVGIDESIYDQIFEPFFSTKEDLNCTGLGLSVVYGIVKQVGGQIRVESSTGEGSLFRIYLPQTESREGAAPGLPPISDETPTTARAEHSGTILLAEDDPTIRQVLKEFLTKRGYQVLVARDGAEGLELSGLYDGEIELLLTDIIMPRMDGLELAQTLIAQRAGTKVLFISGYAQDREILSELLDGTEVDFLKKPFEHDTLELKLQQLLLATPRRPTPHRRLPRAAA